MTDYIDTYYQLTVSAPSQGALQWLNRLSEAHGEERLSIALAEEWKLDMDRRTFLSRTEKRLQKQSRQRAFDAEATRKQTELDQVREWETRMPREQMEANLVRLRAQMVDLGLIE